MSNSPGIPSRRNARVNHEVLVGVTAGNHTFSGWGTNLSAGGVFVNSGHAPAVGTRVHVLLQLPGHGECSLDGRVAWVKPFAPGVDEPGMGIEFVEPGAETRKLIAGMVEKLTQDLQPA
ncbi:MAG TPA: TIGR02266 family protein [Myxococcales bacterium]|nr:TIGR02266 family protein [Myxococcales bacterium]